MQHGGDVQCPSLRGGEVLVVVMQCRISIVVLVYCSPARIMAGIEGLMPCEGKISSPRMTHSIRSHAHTLTHHRHRHHHRHLYTYPSAKLLPSTENSSLNTRWKPEPSTGDCMRCRAEGVSGSTHPQNPRRES